MLVEHGLLQTIENDFESVIYSFFAEYEAEPRRQEVNHVLEQLVFAEFFLFVASRRIFVEKENVTDIVHDVFQTLLCWGGRGEKEVT